MIHSFTVMGVPHGKARPRWTPGQHQPYNPNSNKTYEANIAWCYRRKYHDTFGDRPIGIYITAFMPIPKSAPKMRVVDMMVNKIRPTVKPDWDNIGKIVCDALNGVAYNDDKQIVTGTVTKLYGTEPKVVVTMFDIDQLKPSDVADKCRFRQLGINEVETNIFDKETVETDCTVQILENTTTGEVSVGWWRTEK